MSNAAAATADGAIPCTTVTGEAVAKPFRQAIIDSTSQLSVKPKLVGLLANTSAPSRAYAQWTAKACEAVGIEYELREIVGAAAGQDQQDEEGAVAEQGQVEEAILDANADPSVNGIMVYYPIFGPRQDSYLQQAVSPLKDVEGLNFTWLFSLYHNQRFIDPRKLALAAQVTSPTPAITAPSQVAATATSAAKTNSEGTTDDHLVKAILPCTPLAIVKTLEHCQVYNPLLPYGGRAYGKTITVINRSEVVGRPLAALLSNDGARVFSVDLDGIQEFTKRKQTQGGARAAFHPHHVVQSCKLSLEECLALSDAVVSGVPSKAYQVKTEHLKDGVVAINFSENKNFEPTVKERASIYVPGIGKATIVLLQRNLMRLRDMQASLTESQENVSTA